MSPDSNRLKRPVTAYELWSIVSEMRLVAWTLANATLHTGDFSAMADAHARFREQEAKLGRLADALIGNDQ